MIEIIVAILAFAGTLCGAYFANRKSTALIAFRLEELEKKVNKHNNLIERTYLIEKRLDVDEEKLKVANHRIEDLERAE